MSLCNFSFLVFKHLSVSANPLGAMFANIIVPLVVGTKDTSNIPTMVSLICNYKLL